MHTTTNSQLPVFVYGFLRQSANEDLEKLIEARVDATLPGYKLYLLETDLVPYAIPATSGAGHKVVGTLLYLTEANYAEALAELDELEDCNEAGEFSRTQLTVQYTDPNTGGIIQTPAWIYLPVAALHLQISERGEWVDNGDWLDYRKNFKRRGW